VLLVIGTVATVIAAFAYLRVALAVATPASDGEAIERERHPRVDTGTWIVLAITAGVTIVLGIVPAVFVHWAQDATLLTHVITWF
jgi:NADH:ubiquinone oxidoreductase subunit 2 (subunit N)